MSEDKNLTCRQCGREFAFTQGEQEFYRRKGLSSPRRCPECRSAKQIQPQPLICSQCKTELDKGTSICCTACLASVHLQTQLEIRQSQKAVDEAKSKLLVVQSREAELAESLRHKEHAIPELENRVHTLSQELEKLRQFHTDLQWIHPAVDGIRERLEALEHGQNKTNQRMLQVAESMHELYENTGILGIVKRILGRYQNQAASSK